MKRILCSLLVATLPFGSVLADAPKSKNSEDRPFDIPGVVGLYHEQHWTSRACHSVVNYIKKYQWQIIGTIIAAASYNGGSCLKAAICCLQATPAPPFTNPKDTAALQTALER